MDEYIDVSFELSEKCNFGYLENDGLCIYIMTQDESDSEKVNISQIVLELIAKKFLTSAIYSRKYLVMLISEIESNIKSNIDYNDCKCSVAIILTDFNTYLAANIGNIRYIHKDSSGIKYMSSLDNMVWKNKKKIEGFENSEYIKYITNCIGGINTLEINISDYITLKQDDEILIQGINAWTNKNLDEIKLKVKKIVEFDNKPNKINKTILMIISIFLFSIIFFAINWNRKRIIYNQIKSLQDSKKIYLKHIDVQNLIEIIKKENNLYNSLYTKKLLLKTNNDIERITNFKNINYKIETEIQLLRKTKLKINEAEKLENVFNYQDSNKIYSQIRNIDKFEYFNIDELNKKIELGYIRTKEFLQLDDIEKNADVNLSNKQFKIALDDYEKIEKTYIKYGKKDRITNTLVDKINLCKNELQKIREKNEEIKEKIEKLDEKQIKEKQDLYTKFLENVNILQDENQKSAILLELEKINNQIDAKTQEALELVEEAKKYIESKKYRQALDCLIDSNIIFNQLRLEKYKKENNNLIRQVKQKIRDNVEFKEKRNMNVNKNEIVESINLSIKSGDEYVIRKQWDKAIIEYNRAITFAKQINADTSLIEKKLGYAIRKKKFGWFDIWN